MKIGRGEEGASVAAPDAPVAESPLPLNIPYGFAKRFGVALLGEEDGHLSIVMREGANPRTLIEVRRFLSRPFDVQFAPPDKFRSEEHTSELQSLMRISYAVFCLQKKKTSHQTIQTTHTSTQQQEHT